MASLSGIEGSSPAGVHEYLSLENVVSCTGRDHYDRLIPLSGGHTGCVCRHVRDQTQQKSSSFATSRYN